MKLETTLYIIRKNRLKANFEQKKEKRSVKSHILLEITKDKNYHIPIMNSTPQKESKRRNNVCTDLYN